MSRSREFLIGGLAALGMVALNVLVVSSALGFVHKPRRVLETDHLRYIAMAEALPGLSQEPQAREAPFCWRVLAPALVRAAGLAGVPLNPAFWITTLVCLALFLFTLFVDLRARGFALGASVAGVALAGLMPGAVRWYAYQYWMPDPLCLFLVSLGIHLAATGRQRALALTSMLGVLTRESYVIVPVYACLLWLRKDGPKTAVRRALVVFTAPLAAFVALRLMIVPTSGASLVAAAHEMLAFRARHLLDNQLYFATLGSLGVLVPLLVARAPRAAGFVRERYEEAAVVALVYFSLAFANNTDRLLVYALPVLIPAGLRVVYALARASQVPLDWMTAGVLGLQAFVYWRTPFHGTPGLSLYQPVQWSVVVVLVASGVAAAALLRRTEAS